MVKHAVRDAEPLFTAEERVDAALAKLRKGINFSDEQLQWLARVREHLIVNLAVDESDFDDLPVFSREGGWVVANRAFDGRLADMLRSINAALAA
jgi:type I restriction enzyme R subunit